MSPRVFTYDKITQFYHVYNGFEMYVNGVRDYRFDKELEYLINLEKEYEKLFSPEIKNLVSIKKHRKHIYKLKHQQDQRFHKYLYERLQAEKVELIIYSEIHVKLEHGLVHSYEDCAINYNSDTGMLNDYYIKGIKYEYDDWSKHPEIRKRKIKKLMNNGS